MKIIKELKLIVYQMENNKISPIGILQEYTSLSYTPCFDEVGTFELVVPYSHENMNLLSRQDDCEKLVYLEDNIMGICHKVEASQSPDDKTIKVKGNLAEGLLENSTMPLTIIPPSDTAQDAVEIQNLIYEKAQNSLSSTTGSWWAGVIPIIHDSDNSYKLTEGFNGGRSTSRNFVESLCKMCDKGYSVRLDPETSKFNLRVEPYANRTVNQSTNSPVIISANLGTLYSSKFSLNSQNYKNIVTGVATYIYNGTEYTTELSVTYDEYGTIANIPRKKRRAVYTEVDLTDEEITQMSDIPVRLRREIKQVLYDYALVKSYGCTINDTEGTFKFGVDYFLGDKVTIYDEELQLQLDAQLKEYTKTYSLKGETFEPVFGFSQPTLNRILKQKGVI